MLQYERGFRIAGWQWFLTQLYLCVSLVWLKHRRYDWFVILDYLPRPFLWSGGLEELFFFFNIGTTFGFLKARTVISYVLPACQNTVDITFRQHLGPVQTSSFSCAKSNVNEQNPLFKLICIWFGAWKVRRLNWALNYSGFQKFRWLNAKLNGNDALFSLVSTSRLLFGCLSRASQELVINSLCSSTTKLDIWLPKSFKTVFLVQGRHVGPKRVRWINSFRSVYDLLILLWLTPDDFTRQGETFWTRKDQVESTSGLDYSSWIINGEV